MHLSFYQYLIGRLIKLNNGFVIPDSDPPVINILYGNQEFVDDLDYFILCSLL